MNPNDFGKKFIVEECQKVEIKSLLKVVKSKLKESLLSSEIAANGFSILLISTKTGFGGVRYWFSCPFCKRASGTLYAHPVTENMGCRRCLRLDYRQRRFKGMVENSFKNN